MILTILAAIYVIIYVSTFLYALTQDAPWLPPLALAFHFFAGVATTVFVVTA